MKDFLPSTNNFQEAKTLSVKEFLEAVNIFLEELGVFKIRGEIQQKKLLNRGYEFFTLKDPKDEKYSLECYIAGRTLNLHRHLLKDGMEIVIWGVPGIYKTGRFRLVVSNIEPVGLGSLHQAFEALKAELEQKGYFSLERKRKLPIYFEKIGLITSESGDALHDFLKHLGNDGLKIFFLDTKVEGEDAPSKISRALNWFNLNMADLDFLVLVRGGGGMENLKAFNTKEVAQEIFTSKLPVITGIGHEKDKTIADLVSDISLATPSIAGEFLKRLREQLVQRVDELENKLIETMDQNIKEEKNKLNFLSQHLSFALQDILKEIKFSMNKLIAGAELKMQNYINKYQNLKSHLRILDPRALLDRGYSITLNTSGKTIKHYQEVQMAETLETILKKGRIFSIVKKTTHD